MAAAAMCSICLDDDAGIAFECRTLDCEHQMCEPRLKGLLGDSSAANDRSCPMRRESAGARMAEAIAGKGAARLVEHELCASVKHDVKSDCLKKKEGAD